MLDFSLAVGHHLLIVGLFGTFLLIGLTVPPTIAFPTWCRADIGPDPRVVARVRRWLWAERVLFALLPISAAAFARGYDADWP